MQHWFGIWFEVSDNYSGQISYSTTLVSISSEFWGSALAMQSSCCATPFSVAALNLAVLTCGGWLKN